MKALEAAEAMEPPAMDPLENMTELDAGPGQRLRQGREAVNLSIEEVAARLHLDTRTVRCLEADQYEELPAPTFVRGYLRSYARLLNIPAQPIVDAFDRTGLEPPALIPDISTSEEARSTDMPMRLATGLLVIALVGLVALYWQSEIGTDWIWGPPGQESEQVRLPTSLEPSLPRLEAGEAPTESESLAQGSNTAGSPADGTVALPPASAPPPIPGDGAPEPPPPAELAAVPQVPIALPQTTQPPAATPGVAHLVMRIRRDSWVEIYDRNGERLYYATGKAGDVIDVRGAEPVQVLLGFAEGVNVEYNNQPFALEPHMARGVARFTLGQ